MDTADPAVRARGLVKRFGGLAAVDGIDLEIPRGVCYGLLGPNGAGKTTAIRMIQGVSPVTEGALEVLGLDVRREGRAIRGRIGVVPQEDNLDPDFTVRDNLRVYARFFGRQGPAVDERADRLLDMMDLTGKKDARIDHLSGGMKRRLVVARALVNDPELLVLDEPTTGLDPQARHALWDRIRRLRREGKTILLTTHYMDEAEMLCDELVVIDHGRVLERGRPRDLVRKHCGTEALELVVVGAGSDAADEADRLDALVAAVGDVPHERLPDRVIAYGEALQGLQERVLAACAPDEAILRRATLEDVFLRLTGRALRD